MNTIVLNHRIKLSVIFSAFAFVMMLNVSASDGNKNFRHLAIIESREELAVENWMYDLSEWKSGEGEKENVTSVKVENKLESMAVAEFNAQTKDKIAEDEIILEDWMLDAGNKFWQNKAKTTDTIETEEIEIEDWMTDLSKW